MDDKIQAFTLDQAARLSGLSNSRIRYWADTGFFEPRVRSQKGTPFGRIYSFRDVVALRTLSMLRNEFQIPLQQLRRVGDWLNEHYDDPWAKLRFFVAGNEVYFRDPRIDQVRHGRQPEQVVVPIELEVVALTAREEALKLRDRSPNEHGKVCQHRNVSHNAPVIGGTRVRTEAIWNFHQAGFGVDQILEQYPRLVRADVDAAIAFESKQRRSLASSSA